MTKQECVKALQQTAEAAGFITMGEIKRFTGIKKTEHAKKYVNGLDLIGGKYYFIPDVAGVIMSLTKAGGSAR